jgi:hypothetical protein
VLLNREESAPDAMGGGRIAFGGEQEAVGGLWIATESAPDVFGGGEDAMGSFSTAKESE